MGEIEARLPLSSPPVSQLAGQTSRLHPSRATSRAVLLPKSDDVEIRARFSRISTSGKPSIPNHLRLLSMLNKLLQCFVPKEIPSLPFSLSVDLCRALSISPIVSQTDPEERRVQGIEAAMVSPCLKPTRRPD